MKNEYGLAVINEAFHETSRPDNMRKVKYQSDEVLELGVRFRKYNGVTASNAATESIRLSDPANIPTVVIPSPLPTPRCPLPPRIPPSAVCTLRETDLPRFIPPTAAVSQVQVFPPVHPHPAPERLSSVTSHSAGGSSENIVRPTVSKQRADLEHWSSRGPVGWPRRWSAVGWYSRAVRSHHDTTAQRSALPDRPAGAPAGDIATASCTADRQIGSHASTRQFRPAGRLGWGSCSA